MEHGEAGREEPDENPYSIPTTSSKELRSTPRARNPGELELASLGARFGGFVIDSAIFMVFYIAFVGVMFTFASFNASNNPGGATGAQASASLVTVGLLVLAIFMVYFAIWIYLIATRGQTLGKLALGTQIVDAAGHKAGFARILFLRTLIPLIIPLFPYVSPFFIFGDKRQCLHDMLASTYVVKYRRK